MDTRERILAAALQLFAERGFYGASMDQIAGELGLTKQALIHHFGTKEKLYGAVLAGISEKLIGEAVRGAQTAPSPPFADVVARIFQFAQTHRDDTLLLMRELLDNRRRAAQAGTWYLRPFLDRLAALLGEDPNWQGVSVPERITHIYQVLGAINYFVVSTSTLKNMYSSRHVSEMRKCFPDRLKEIASMSPA